MRLVERSKCFTSENFNRGTWVVNVTKVGEKKHTQNKKPFSTAHLERKKSLSSSARKGNAGKFVTYIVRLRGDSRGTISLIKTKRIISGREQTKYPLGIRRSRCSKRCCACGLFRCRQRLSFGAHAAGSDTHKEPSGSETKTVELEGARNRCRRLEAHVEEACCRSCFQMGRQQERQK